MQNPHFESKIKISKNISKSILQIILTSSVQKTARKNTKYWRNEVNLKTCHHAKSMQNPHFGSKTKIPKKHVKIHSTNHLEVFCEKNRSKNTKYSRNKTILKIGHHAKAKAHAKSSLWVKH